MNYSLCRTSTSQSGTAVRTLSAELRAQTSLLHRQIEVLLGLPGVICTPDDNARWLGRFLGFYAPLECEGFPEWDNLGIRLPARSHSACLATDFAALGADPARVTPAAPTQLAGLSDFAHALGALYVMEGATLGGRLILRDLEMRLGDTIADATCFFGGRGERVGPMWQSFREALAMLAWFAPLCAERR